MVGQNFTYSSPEGNPLQAAKTYCVTFSFSISSEGPSTTLAIYKKHPLKTTGK